MKNLTDSIFIDPSLSLKISELCTPTIEILKKCSVSELIDPTMTSTIAAATLPLQGITAASELLKRQISPITDMFTHYDALLKTFQLMPPSALDVATLNSFQNSLADLASIAISFNVEALDSLQSPSIDAIGEEFIQATDEFLKTIPEEEQSELPKEKIPSRKSLKLSVSTILSHIANAVTIVQFALNFTNPSAATNLYLQQISHTTVAIYEELIDYKKQSLENQNEIIANQEELIAIEKEQLELEKQEKESQEE